jgi:hypothetical protein
MLKLTSYLVLVAIVHALWEIQIEGKDGGWARKLPTFRINVFFRKLLGGKPLTGYHIFMLLLFQLIFHSPLILFAFSWTTEALIQGYFIWYFIIEDAAWFILNPYYTLTRFRKHHIQWHKRWFLGLPLSYWVGGVIGTILLFLGGALCT